MRTLLSRLAGALLLAVASASPATAQQPLAELRQPCDQALTDVGLKD